MTRKSRRSNRAEMRAARCAIFLAATLALLSLPGAWGVELKDEYSVKAAFLYNFAKFVKWPDPAPEVRPLAFCVLGEDPFGPVLDETIGGRTVADRAIVIRRIAAVEDANRCNVLFLASAEDRNVARVLHEVAKSPVLTVGESKAFIERGGIIRFLTEERKIRFEVNPDAAERAGLKLSSQLLKLAIVVPKKPEREEP